MNSSRLVKILLHLRTHRFIDTLETCFCETWSADDVICENLLDVHFFGLLVYFTSST